MLSLTRTLSDNCVLIGDDIKVYISAIKGNQVKIAIDAPRELNIVRAELVAPELNRGRDRDRSQTQRESLANQA